MHSVEHHNQNSPGPVRAAIGQRWRELARFSLFFRILESLVFAPVAALIGKWLVGRTVLDSTALVPFLLSPRGFLALVCAGTALLAIRLIEHAGLSVIFFGQFHGRRIRAREAARIVRRHLLTLVRVSARFVGLGLLTLLPLLATAGAFAAWLLPQHDVNYYLKLRPPEFVTAAVVIGAVAVVTAALAVALVVRWRWAVQAVLFEQRNAPAAFARSAALSKGMRWKLARTTITVSLLSIGLGLAASLLGTACASIVLRLLGQGTASLAIAFGALLLLRTVFGAVGTFLGACVDAGVFTSLYSRRVAESGGQASLTEVNVPGPLVSARLLVAGCVACLLFVAASGAWLAFSAFSKIRSATVHAHRGVWTGAPENSLAAMREAIAAGAEYLETDIQLSKDGVPVVVHDSDFSRLGGVAKKVRDLTWEEIRAIPLSHGAAPRYQSEVTPSFDQLLTEARGRIKVNIEIKFYGERPPDLVPKVIAAVRAHQMLDQVVVQCLEYEPLLEVRQLAPEVPIGYLLSFNARDPSRLEVDFLSVEQNRLDRDFITRAHQSGQLVFAWTVNTPGDLQRAVELGVDGVITDQSALARKILDEYYGRPGLERFTRQIRTWLAD